MLLIRRIGADDQEAWVRPYLKMSRAGRQQHGIAGGHRDVFSLRTAENQACGTACEAKYLVRIRMIMMEGVNAIAPLRRPAIPAKHHFKFCRHSVSAGLSKNPAVQQDRKPRIRPTHKIELQDCKVHLALFFHLLCAASPLVTSIAAPETSFASSEASIASINPRVSKTIANQTYMNADLLMIAAGKTSLPNDTAIF
jgi:hypothetical protein